MILPAATISERVIEKLPPAREWAETASKAGLVSIGVVGEAVHTLPGFLVSMDVSSSLLEDSIEQEGRSGSIKVVHGWKDCDVSINLILLDIPTIEQGKVTPNISRYDCLAQIAGIFKRMKNGKPQIYTIHHPHLEAWGAKAFIFSGLKSNESQGKQTITCSLDFDEYDSSTGKSQDRQIGIEEAQQQQGEAQAPYIPDKNRAGLGELEAKYGAS